LRGFLRQVCIKGGGFLCTWLILKRLSSNCTWLFAEYTPGFFCFKNLTQVKKAFKYWTICVIHFTKVVCCIMVVCCNLPAVINKF
jgi:hypothetical protein